MNKAIKVSGVSYKMGAGLFLIYFVHLFAFHCLLSNPNDYLTTHSFSDYQTKPDKSSDCLLMLADKQDNAKQVNGNDNTPVAAPHLTTSLFKQLPAVTSVTFFTAQHLYGYGGKLYRLLCIFRI